ncbi:restriction endonuclease subunit S [Acidovorax sp. D2M1]|uniref:Restriction endonuclease subunit S n=1 Tax=Acidovorax benzenivorans TaxID=2987520 RepID=A0ABT5RWQ1_9BURK|nr:restriction endonuclease subunit S [Acidovorax benzenivorans]MDD2178124.1 restriction endonuclease subunit S [Acidovorax benzenivorans]
MKDLTRFGVDLSSARHISTDDFAVLVKQGCRPQVGDVLIAKDGNSALDTVCCVDKELEAVLLSSVAILRPDPTRLNYQYLKHYLSSPDVVEYLKSNFISGAAIPRVVLKDFKKAEICVPPLKEQARITAILNTFDDRITLLRATNATLEAIAQALFKSWFIDFDPVRTKMEGRAPEGMDEATAALFPDALEESELGWVPKGWRMSRLADLTSTHHGSIQTGPFGSQLHASDYVDSGVPVVMPKDIKDRRVMTDSIARVSQENADRLSRHKLIAGDIVFSRRGDVERHALITQREAGWLCGTGCLLLRPGKSWRSSTFLSMALDAAQARTWLVQHAVGATMPNINTGILGSVPVLLPPDALLSAFEDVVSATELQRSHNSSTAETLSALRDTLLPRLISGQLRLPEAQALVDDV